MKEILAGRLGPVFHADKTITLLDVKEVLEIGDRVEYVAPNFYHPGHNISLGAGTVIKIDGDSVTINNMTLPQAEKV